MDEKARTAMKDAEWALWLTDVELAATIEAMVRKMPANADLYLLREAAKRLRERNAD